MKFAGAVLLAVLLTACGGPAKTESATAELKPYVEKVYAAWATLDVTKPAPYYAKDPNLLFFDVAPLKYTGWQAYADGFKQASADWKSAKLEVGPDFQAFKNGNVAWAAYTLHLELETKGGTVQKADARGLDVLEKRDDKWIIVSEHVSMPAPAIEEKKPEPKPAPAHKKQAPKKSRKR
jgi:ketosteroid isomerase-like protein